MELLVKDNTDVLAQITRLALEQKEVEANVAQLEESLTAAKKKLAELAEEKIPTLMEEVGMTEFTMKDGSKVKTTKKYRGYISKDRADKCYAWIDEHGHSNLVTRQFIIDFNKEQEDQAKQFEEVLKDSEDPLRYDKKNSIPWQSLDKFITEQLEDGVDFPQELFGVYVQRGTKITAG